VLTPELLRAEQARAMSTLRASPSGRPRPWRPKAPRHPNPIPAQDRRRTTAPRARGSGPTVRAGTAPVV